MPTAMLSGASPAYLPARPITLFVERESNGPPIEILVSPDAGVRRPRPGMVIVPSVERPLTVSVRMAGGEPFPSPTILHLSAVVTDPNGADQDRVLVPSVSVGGLPVAELMILDRAGSNVSVRRPEADEVPNLTETGNAALLAARSRLAVSRLPEADRRDLRLVIDASASMARPAEDGSLALAVDVLTGIAAVVGRRTALAATVAGPVAHQVTADPPALARAVTASLTSAGLGNGFVVGDALPAGDGATYTYVISDSIPADHESLDPGYHLVLLADASCAAVVASMSDMPVSVVDHRPGSGAGPGSGRPDVAGLVASLLAPFERASR